ncbi:heparinase II/III family protein [Paenibacillus sp. GYB004]|uniref:heparinase II/III domain-containing protein n=1 Tax=Paenibacillus sp. GYB004 TaxID=2994393 RepID=UPI002F9612DE
MNTNKWAVLAEIPSTPAADGGLAEKEWSEAAILDDFRTAYFNERVADGPRYKLAYDSTHLYIAGTFASEDRPVLDKIELIVSTMKPGEPHYIVSIPVTPAAKTIKTGWGETDLQPITVQVNDCSLMDAGDRTVVEAKVSWSSLGSAPPSPGTRWRMNVVHVHHLGSKPLISWVPVRTSRFWDTGSSIVMVNGNVIDEGRLGSLFFARTPTGRRWVPQDAGLRYVDFTHKEVSFKEDGITGPQQSELALKWKAPSGDWMPLPRVSSGTDGTRRVLTFEHPPVSARGLIELQMCVYRGDCPDDGLFAILSFDRDEWIEAGLAVSAKVVSTGNPVRVQPEPASRHVQHTLELIPDKTGFIFTGLPEMPELHPDQLFKLSDDRRSLVSIKTGTVYPNARYPETKVVTAINRKGEAVDYPYYEDEAGKRYFLSARLWYLQRHYTVAETETIAGTDALGAARLLYRFAEVYEGYVPTTDYIWHNYPISITSGPPFNYWGGMWCRWSVAELNSLRPLLRAYDRVKQTNAFDVLSEEVGEDVDRKIVRDMFIPSIQYALAYPYVLGNMNYTQWLGLIEAGKALNEPDYIHNAFQWMEDYVETQFLSDGYWREAAPSYHVQSTNGLAQAADALSGYSDPDGYVSPRTGRRFDNLDMRTVYPAIGMSVRNNNLLVYPDGKLLPLQDAWASDMAGSPLLDAGPLLMPAAGIARLAGGTGADQTQVWLQFEPKYGHNHYGPLQLNLYAAGQELLPDLGYTYTKDRAFTLSAIGHNTVVVDSKDMKIDDVSKHGGRISLFAPMGDVQAMRADQKEAYEGVDQYGREPWLILFPGAAEGEGYVVDLFRVSGGSRHEYTLQGDANRDAWFETALEQGEFGPHLLPPGTKVKEAEQFNERGSAEGHYYGYISIRNVKRAHLPGDRYEVTLVTSEDGAEKAKMNITGLLEPGGNELYLARSPSIRSTRLSGKSADTNDEAAKYDMPKLVLRRDGTRLNSTFVTVMEPYAGAAGPRIETIERLQLSEGPEGALAIRVTYGRITDLLISSTGHPDQTIVADGVTMRGKMGFVRTEDGVVRSMYLIGGTLLATGGVALTGMGTIRGEITSTKRKANGDPYNGIVTRTPIGAAAADAMRGAYVVVTHPDESARGFRIKETIGDSGSTVIVFDEYDPGFEIRPDGTSIMSYYPAKRWNGTHTFTFDGISVYGSRSPESEPVHHQAGAAPHSVQY